MDLGPDFDLDLLGIPDFVIEPADFISKVNSGDENAEWVDMPEFKDGDKKIRLILEFNNELEREQFTKNNKIIVDRKMNNQWISKI